MSKGTSNGMVNQVTKNYRSALWHMLKVCGTTFVETATCDNY